MISNNITNTFYLIILIFLGILLFFCLLRAIRGPEVADRLVATNMMGTIVLVMICTLSQLLNEAFLIDVAIVYALLSFLSVVLITKLYMGAHAEHKANIDVDADLEAYILNLKKDEAYRQEMHTAEYYYGEVIDDIIMGRDDNGSN